jgi:hypothetical protein
MASLHVLHGPDPLDSLSPNSATPLPSRKRPRQPRASTSTSIGIPNGHHTAASSSKPPRPTKPLGRPKLKTNVVVPDTWCSFCAGTTEANRDKKPEKMVSCTLCGRSGHFSCLGFKTAGLIQAVQSYDWLCIECKPCEVCKVKGDDVSYAAGRRLGRSRGADEIV